ncbi:hypothetical protein vseg_000978 [Gypsophila vaccaria]
MATTVFGTPVTRRSLARMVEFKDKEITLRDLAEVAFEMKNDDGKDAKARAYVDANGAKYGAGYIPCLIYNATGDTITLQTYHNAGSLISPCPYPLIIMNGQWGAYLKPFGGAVVYSAKNEDGNEFQIVYAYVATTLPNLVYTEIREKGYYKGDEPWITYLNLLMAKPSNCYQVHDSGFTTFATIGDIILNNSAPVFEGIITLTGAWPQYVPGPLPPPPPCYPPSIKCSDQEARVDNTSLTLSE